MKFLNKILRRLGLIPDFSEDDRLNASTEDALRMHTTQVEKVKEVTQKRVRGNAALRRSIFVAKARTNSFADFEGFVRRGDHGGNDR